MDRMHQRITICDTIFMVRGVDNVEIYGRIAIGKFTYGLKDSKEGRLLVMHILDDCEL